MTQPYFQKNFGMLNPNGSKNARKVNDLSSNVVSVLQAGAFFGALGSAPLSNWIGRRWTLIVFTIIFSVGAVRVSDCDNHPYIAHMRVIDIGHNSWGKPRLELHICWSNCIWNRNRRHIGGGSCLRF